MLFFKFWILDLQRDPFLEMCGAFMFQHLRCYGYEELIRNLANNVLEFLQNLDFVQSYLKEDYQDLVMPHFRCDDDSVSDRMILHYFSYRPGYQRIVMGIGMCLLCQHSNKNVHKINQWYMYEW